jgi:hypothetical protein
LLQCHISPQRVAQAGDEELDLLLFGQGCVATRQRNEALAELIGGVETAQYGQLADGAVCQRWPEACIDELDKLRLGGAAAVEFHAVEPKLGVAQQVECRECYLVAWCLTHMEESLAAIQPWQGVVGAVELREFHLVRRGVRVIDGFSCVVVPSVPPGVWRTLAGLDVMDDILQHLLVSLLIGHRCLQRLDSRSNRLEPSF